MATYSYKCPNCSGPLNFKPEIGKLKCDYCGSEFTTEDIDAKIEKNPDQHEVKLEHIKGYNCQNCGAEVVTTDTTLTTFCYYCHSPVVLTDRAQGDFKPSSIIPFAIDREKAEDMFLKWVGNKRYVKKSFYSQSQLEKITGMYLPYWSIDATYDINLEGTGYKKSSYRRGDTEYTDTSSYRINRGGDYTIKNLSELAYSKVDKKLLDSITPFKFDDAKPFKIFYMNGFFSETYDKIFEDVEPLLLDKSEKFTKRMIMDELSEYNNYDLDVEDFSLTDWKKDYLLLPTWMMTYDYNGKKYIYAMNGQTGKAFGELPIDNNLILRDALIAGIVVFLLILLGGAFIW